MSGDSLLRFSLHIHRGDEQKCRLALRKRGSRRRSRCCCCDPLCSSSRKMNIVEGAEADDLLDEKTLKRATGRRKRKAEHKDHVEYMQKKLLPPEAKTPPKIKEKTSRTPGFGSTGASVAAAAAAGPSLVGRRSIPNGG